MHVREKTIFTSDGEDDNRTKGRMRAQRFWTIRSISSWNSPRMKYPFSSVYPIRQQQQQQNQKGRHTIEMGSQVGIDGYEPDDESLILSSASFLK
jgi:hypothetical protein